MKKSFKGLVMIAILSSMFAIVGCEKGSDGSNDPKDTDQTNLNYLVSSDSNKWEIVKSDPRINIITLPNMNQEGTLSGKIRIANPETYFVAMYEKVDNTWFRKPYADYDIVVKTGGGFNVSLKSSSSSLIAIVALPKGRIAPPAIGVTAPTNGSIVPPSGGTELSIEFALDAYIIIKR